MGPKGRAHRDRRGEGQDPEGRRDGTNKVIREGMRDGRGRDGLRDGMRDGRGRDGLRDGMRDGERRGIRDGLRDGTTEGSRVGFRDGGMNRDGIRDGGMVKIFVGIRDGFRKGIRDGIRDSLGLREGEVVGKAVRPKGGNLTGDLAKGPPTIGDPVGRPEGAGGRGKASGLKHAWCFRAVQRL